jgi:hypothetical protein
MVVSGNLHSPAALPLNGPQRQFCHHTHENANWILCDVSSEAEERVLVIEKQYVRCKVRIYVTETVENR